jgi:chemotaxis signal transduction protein
MEHPSTTQALPVFFSFRVSNLPDSTLAVLVSEVEMITDAVQIIPIPLAPPTVYGVCYWENHVITMVDLAAVLCGSASLTPLQFDQRIMIARVPVHDKFQYLGWPIEGYANIMELTGVVYVASTSSFFESKVIEESISIENEKIVILRLAGLFD